MTSHTRILSLAAAVAAAMALGPPVARADDNPSSSDPSSSSEAPMDQQTTIDDTDIQAFAHAALDVHRVKMKWLPEVQAASRQGPAAEVATEQKAMEEMAQAVEKNGLSVDKYNEIVDLAESDPLVQHKIAMELKQNGGDQLTHQPGGHDHSSDDNDDTPPRTTH